MSNDDLVALANAAIEEELGKFREFADLPSTALEDIAGRITRAVSPYIQGKTINTAEDRAA